MIYAYDQQAQMPVRDLFDTQMMAMAINAAKDMYEKSQQEMKDFKKEYQDFLSPIQKDMDWYKQNVTDKVKNTIDSLYAAGIDPLRSAEGRAAVSRAINSIDVGTVSKLRQSALNAEAFNKAKRELQAKGLYNQALDKYDGPQLENYSTLDSGVWNKMSPTPYQNMSEFSKPYFDNVSPIQRTDKRDGITYTVQEITKDMLTDIANKNFSNLVNTQQGQLMYKMYKDLYGSDDLARQAFTEQVVSGNIDKLHRVDNFEKMKLENQKLNLDRQRLNLQQQKWNHQLQAEEDAKNNAARGWTYRQRVGVMDSNKMNKQYVDDLNKARRGCTHDGAKEQLIKEGIGNPTENQIKARMSKNKKFSNEQIAKNYAAYTTSVTGDDKETALDIASGFTNRESIGDINGTKRHSITFSGDGTLSLTKSRQLKYAGLGTTSESAINKLQRKLEEQHISGYIPDEDHVSVSRMQTGNRTGYWDINTTIRVRKDQLENIYGAGLDDVLKTVGAVSVGKQTKYYDTAAGRAQFRDYEYVDIPVTRTVPPTVFSDSEIDMWHDSHYITKSVAAKRQTGYEVYDIDELD